MSYSIILYNIIIYYNLILCISMRFLDDYGVDVSDVTKLNKFKIQLELNKEEMESSVIEDINNIQNNNKQNTNDIINIDLIFNSTLYNLKNKNKIKFIENKCKYYITDISINNTNIYNNLYDTNNNNMYNNIIHKYFIYSYGYYDICNNTLIYSINNKIYSYVKDTNGYMYNTYNKDNYIGNNIIKEKKINKNIYDKINKTNSNGDKLNIKNDSNTNTDILNNINFNVFIIINDNTFIDYDYIFNMFYYVNIIFNNYNININIIDMISVDGSISNIDELRKIMNEIKTKENKHKHKHNYNKNIKDSSIIMLLNINNNINVYHDITFNNGANKFDINYSIVNITYDNKHNVVNFISEHDNKYNSNDINNDNMLMFNIRKVSHEIAHSMGVPHDINIVDIEKYNKDNNPNNHNLYSYQFIMSKKDKSYKHNINNSNINNTKNIILPNEYLNFSNTSIFYINKFYGIYVNKHNSDISNEFITNVTDAHKLIRSLRNRTYGQIVNDTLGGKEPDTLKTKYYLIVSLLFYVISVLSAVYYIK